MARAKHAHLPALAHDLLHLSDRFGMVHAIGAEADVASPVTKLHRRTTPVPLRVSKIPSSRPSCPRAGRRTGTYGYLASNKHGMGRQSAGWSKNWHLWVPCLEQAWYGPAARSLRASARVNVGSRGSLSLGACSSASGTWRAGLHCVPGRMMIAWAHLFGGSGRRTNTVIAPRFAPTLFVCSSTYRMTIRRRGTSFVDCGMSGRGSGDVHCLRK